MVNIGIADKKRTELSKILTQLLSDTYTLFLMSQNFHWNVSGPLFQPLHSLFGSQYEALVKPIDEIAERIRALGCPVEATFSNFNSLSRQGWEISLEKNGKSIPTPTEMIQRLLTANEELSIFIRRNSDTFQNYRDDASLDLLNRRLAEHEKNAWMLRSTLETK